MNHNGTIGRDEIRAILCTPRGPRESANGTPRGPRESAADRTNPSDPGYLPLPWWVICAAFGATWGALIAAAI